MPVYCPFQTKLLGEAEVGELVAFTQPHGGEFAIKLMQNEMGNSILAAFPTNENALPHMATISGDADCISYGREWIFEIDQHKRFEVLQEEQELAGVARIEGQSVQLRLGRDPHNIHARGGLLDLQQLRLVHQNGFAFYTRAWKLWANEATRSRRDGTPLLTGL
ncbi:hypothetical protein [Sinorhizobium meliloti]|uniref:hypothetical protein n=1 Tax=Rhizobium meliloti TaxID=382 RepID=UPI000FD6BFCB|nr:hypothetical protein [Sinorhizobium meliloti]MDW9816718.1 hypothetical protein [Sinorhizobium meliloti]RVG68137.1 hypothetical protein CN222_08655 [Sinorhizobium meliloti]RVM11560.1 hypothetical protein CN134_21955 [Sinorhizobium meliloti]RVN13036.1 hypothetical protein CN115_16920 [Sinorhizobium meliloti]RVN21781.1 hypothetical protein CN114_19165 [Sinorhizobium meliloti]